MVSLSFIVIGIENVQGRVESRFAHWTSVPEVVRLPRSLVSLNRQPNSQADDLMINGPTTG